MAPKITATIDNLDEDTASKIMEGGGGSRFEVVFDWADGDHHELELHFRLVELTATRPLGPGDHVEYSKGGPPTIHTSGLGGRGPEFEMPLYELRRVPELDEVRLAKLLTSIINLAKISPRVLGIEDGDEPAYKRVLNYLRKR